MATVKRSSPASDQSGDDYLGSTGNGTYSLGSSDDSLAKLAYSSSPVNSETYTELAAKKIFFAELKGVQSLNPDFVTPSGEVGVDMDYSSAPNLSSVVTSDKGGPATSIGPTVGSPTDGTTNVTSLPKVVSNAAELSNGTLGSTLSPSSTSATIADQETIMQKGKSNYTTSIESSSET